MIEQEIRDLICDKALEHLFVSREDVVAELTTWDIEPKYQGGNLIGAILRRGDELHFVTFAGVSLSRRIVADALRPQMECYGHVVTRTPLLAERQHRFNKLIGFREVKRDALDIYYRMERDQCRLSL